MYERIGASETSSESGRVGRQANVVSAFCEANLKKGSPGTSKAKIQPFGLDFYSGGTWRTRTAVLGFADRYLAARSRYHLHLRLQR